MSIMNKKEISVSIIVPVYNSEQYLEKCLDSLIRQTLTSIEIIIIDDGSSDSSKQICEKYDYDQRVSYYYKENEGLAAARQDGMERATGKYIGFIDSDDWAEPDMFEKMYVAAETNEADIVFCNCYFDEDVKDRLHLRPGVYNREAIENEILPRTLAGINDRGNNGVIRWSNCLRIYKRDLIEKNNISFDRRFRRSQDLQLTFETTMNAEKYVSLNNEYLYHNRTENNGNSLSRGYTKNYWNLIKPLIESLYNSIERHDAKYLLKQMDLCTFFFAATGIKNELENSKLPIYKKVKLIDDIVGDFDVQVALKSVEKEALSDFYQMIYEGLLSKNKLKMCAAYAKYRFKKKVYKPIVRKLRNRKHEG